MRRPGVRDHDGRRPWWRAPLAHLAVLVVGGAAAVAVVTLAVSVRGPVGPGEVELRVRPAPGGRTELAVPPLGRISAPTHGAPVGVAARLDRLDVEQLQSLLAERAPQTALRREIEADLPALLRRAVVLVVGVALLAGAAGGALVPHRRWSFLPTGALGGLLAVAVQLGLAFGGFDARAFERAPRFEGPIERAPALLAAAQARFADLDAVRDRLTTLSRRVAQLYTATAAEPTDPVGEVRILHVSDIHLNPVGVEIARQLAQDLDVAAILDTGDLTSFGLPVEARIGQLLADLPVPYYLVPGNHDADANVAALAATPNVTVVDGTTVDIAGVRVLGIADPTFTADGVTATANANVAKLAQAPGVARAVRRDDPDVLAVHDLRQAARSWGLVPLVVAGHTHERGTAADRGTIALTVGSTGATGLGSFTVDADLPYEADVLRFRDGRLTAVDRVRFAGIEGGFEIQRQLAADLVTAPPAADPDVRPPPTVPPVTTGGDGVGSGVRGRGPG